MHAFKSLLTLLVGSSFAVALVVPTSAQADAAAVVVRQNKAPKATPAADDNKANCAAAKKLAAGIDKNIEAQQQELTDVAAVKNIVNTDNVDKAEFDQAKKTLVSTVNKGIQIRENNQKIAPDGNAAIKGLETVCPLLES